MVVTYKDFFDEFIAALRAEAIAPWVPLNTLSFDHTERWVEGRLYNQETKAEIVIHMNYEMSESNESLVERIKVETRKAQKNA